MTYRTKVLSQASNELFLIDNGRSGRSNTRGNRSNDLPRNDRSRTDITIRRATMADRPALEEIKELALAKLLDPLLTPGQRNTMRQPTPFDPALIEDGTYYVATVDGWIAASGGWSRRAALFITAQAITALQRYPCWIPVATPRASGRCTRTRILPARVSAGLFCPLRAAKAIAKRYSADFHICSGAGHWFPADAGFADRIARRDVSG